MLNQPCRQPGCTGIYEYKDVEPPDWGDMCDNPEPAYFIYYECTYCGNSRLEAIPSNQTRGFPNGSDEDVRNQALSDSAHCRLQLRMSLPKVYTYT